MEFRPCYGENCVIVSDDGFRVTFHPRCSECGTVSQNSTGAGSVSNGIAAVGWYSCSRCYAMFPVRLHRG